MTDIQKYPGFVLRDMWIDGALSDEDYSAEIARRVKIKTDKDELIRELVAALAWTNQLIRELMAAVARAEELIPLYASTIPDWMEDVLAKAKEQGYEP